MKKSQQAQTKKNSVPIDWLKPTIFKIPIPRDEKQRLAALYRYDILDTPPERTFDSLAVLASHVCETPVALLVLIDQHRQWFKAKVGVRLKETPREFAFCAHTIMQRKLVIILGRDSGQAFRGKSIGCVGSAVSFLCRCSAHNAGQSGLGHALRHRQSARVR